MGSSNCIQTSGKIVQVTCSSSIMLFILGSYTCFRIDIAITLVFHGGEEEGKKLALNM